MNFRPSRSEQPTLAPTNIGHVIGSSFGLVFVLVNSAPFPPALRIVASVLAIAVFLVILAAFGRTARGVQRHEMAPSEAADATVGFPRRYWIIVGAEAIVLFGGIAILRQFEPSATLGWIALVVGVHFFPLARLWTSGRAQLVVIACAMTGLGIIGLLLAFTTHIADVVAVVSGVGSGIVLLGSAFVVAVRTLTQHAVAR